MPADAFVEHRPDAQRCGDGMAIPARHVRPDQHQLALAEFAAIGNGLVPVDGDDAVRAASGIDEAAQLLRHDDRRVDDLLGVEARDADDPRTDTGARLCHEQRLQAGVDAAGGTTDDVLGRGLGVRAGGDAHNDHEGRALVGDGPERQAQRTSRPGHADRRDDVGDQDRAIEREGGVERVGRSADGGGGGGDQADDGGRFLEDRADAGDRLVDLDAVEGRHGVRILKL